MAILSVQGANNGVGSYTIAANLAAAHTDLHQRVLIVEADERNVLGMWFGRHEHPDLGWAHSYAANQRWQDGLYKSPDKTYFLPYGEAALSNEQVASVLQELLPAAQTRFEHIIVLLPPQFEPHVLAHCIDLPLVVVNPTPSTVTLLARQLVQKRYSDRTRFVMNMGRHDVRLSRDLTLILEDMLGTRLLSSYVYFDMALQEALASLGNVFVKAPKSQACSEFRKLASVTLSHLEQFNQV